jgi:PAS domain S-box-containing protein
MRFADPTTPAESPLTVLTHIAISLDALNCGALLVGRSGVIAHVNTRLCEMTQRRQEELVGADLVNLYPSGDAQEVVRTLLEDFDRSRESEFFLPLADGKRLPVVISARPVGADSVLSEYAVITMIDVSKQKKAERQLIDQNEHIAELSDRVMDQAKILREYADSLEARVKERTSQLHDAHMETIYILAIASEAKDEETGQHVRRLGRMSELLAGRMGVTPSEAERIGYSAVLHDVGKIHTPDKILKKPGPLTTDERSLMEQHTLAGERILNPSPYFIQASRIARSHHENWDGSGYPDGLAGDAIPFEARLVHLVDVYDALVNPRVYKPAWDQKDAVEEIRRISGKMFDPDAAAVFVRLQQTGDLERLAERIATTPSPMTRLAR